jgi:hypothetical protein
MLFSSSVEHVYQMFHRSYDDIKELSKYLLNIIKCQAIEAECACITSPELMTLTII